MPINTPMYKVYRSGEWPRPKRHYYPNQFKKRQQARVFCRNRRWEEGLTIVSPDGTEEAYAN